MTEQEYMNSGCDNRHSIFTLDDGTEITGVITTMFMENPSKFYFVSTNNMLEFMKYMNSNNQVMMRSLSSQIDLASIVDVELMDEPISLTLRANVAFQLLPQDKQTKAQELFNKIVLNKSLLKNENIVHIQNKPYYVVRFDERTRILVEKKKHGIIISDIIFNKQSW